MIKKIKFILTLDLYIIHEVFHIGGKLNTV